MMIVIYDKHIFIVKATGLLFADRPGAYLSRAPSLMFARLEATKVELLMGL
jgi:hypothetical protein